MKLSVGADFAKQILGRLAKANEAFNEFYPWESKRRQPVHTLYGGAHLFRADSARKIGDLALKSLQEYSVDFRSFGSALGLPGWQLPTDASSRLHSLVYERVLEKLKREPVEDFRIDFEDGYGFRADAEEDADARLCAESVALGREKGLLPPFIGIRIKPLSEAQKIRSIRTLDIFLTTLCEAGPKLLPENFLVTLPKVTVPEQVLALSDLLAGIEQVQGLPAGSIKLELMIEQPQIIIDRQGRSALPSLLAAAGGRCVAAHFGAYDYTAACDITASEQTLDHRLCDFARQAMQAAFAGTGVNLSDGAVNVLPIGPHRAVDNVPLTEDEKRENIETVQRACKLNFELVRRSLKNGYYQGWDLHPSQLPVRYAACYSFFLEGLPASAERLRGFVEQAARASRTGQVFDDAASAHGLLNFFRRAFACGALIEEDLASTGLTMDEIRNCSSMIGSRG